MKLIIHHKMKNYNPSLKNYQQKILIKKHKKSILQQPLLFSQVNLVVKLIKI